MKVIARTVALGGHLPLPCNGTWEAVQPKSLSFPLLVTSAGTSYMGHGRRPTEILDKLRCLTSPNGSQPLPMQTSRARPTSGALMSRRTAACHLPGG